MRKKQKIKWKKGLAVVLAATVTTSTFSGGQKGLIPVQAAEGEEPAENTPGEDIPDSSTELPIGSNVSCGTGTVTYSFDNNGVLTFSGTGEVTGTILKGYTNIKKITADSSCGITKLPQNCFEGCTGITEVDLSNLSLTELPVSCFAGCTGLAEIVIPENITIINGYCFKGCSNLQRVDIPETVTKISAYSFDSCSALNHVSYKGSKASWEKIDGIDQYAASGLNVWLMGAQKSYGKYALIFNVNGGDSISGGSGTNSIETAANTATTLKEADGSFSANIPTAEKNNWVFVGWNTNPSAKEALSTISVAESDIELYAIFKKTLTAAFVDSDQAGSNETAPISKDIYNKETEAVIEMPALPAKTTNGTDVWTAVGWSAAEGTISPVIKPGEEISISKNTKYYAVYKRTINITYNAGVVPDGTNGPMSVVGLPKQVTETRYYVGGQFIEPSFTLLQNISKTGYLFSHWDDGNGTTYQAGDQVTVNTDTVFTAVWTAEAAAVPKIVTEPNDIKAAYGYENASMQVKAEIADASNYTLSYQWFEETTNGATINKVPVSGATSPTLTIPKGKGAGTYSFYCEVTAERNDNNKTSTITSQKAAFTVEKAEREIAIKILEKIFDKKAIDDSADSKITVTVTDKAAGTVLTDLTNADLTYSYYKDNNGELGSDLSSAPSEPGTYWVEVKTQANANYKAASAKKKFTISYLPTPENPYILKSADGTKILENKEWYSKSESSGIIIAPASGYKIAENDYKNTFGTSISVSGEGKHTVSFYLQDSTGKITDKISIPMNIDTTSPTGTVQLQSTIWRTLLNNITFDRFFKDTQSVRISGEDEVNGSGVDSNSIYYLLASSEMTEQQLKDSSNWIKYTAPLSLSPEAKYIVYARITDKAGNVCYLSSDGLEFENTKPVINGISNSGSYYGDLTFEVTDSSGLKSIVLNTTDFKSACDTAVDKTCVIQENGNRQCSVEKIDANKDKYTLKLDAGCPYASFSLTATDNAGNIESIDRFTVYNIYQVTYENEDGTIIGTPLSVNYNQQAVLPENLPTKTGYSLAGWYKKGDTNKKDFDFNTGVTENITLIPKWKPNTYQILFDSQDGSICSPITVTYDQTVGVMPLPTLTGYKFLGWYTSKNAADAATGTETGLTEYDGSSTQSGKVEKNTTTVKFTGDITLYAKWEKSTYHVSFESENGTFNTDDAPVPPNDVYDKGTNTLAVKYDEAYGYLPKVTRGGYKFLGWYTDKNSGNKVESSTLYKNTNDITLYAHWQEDTFSVALDYNYTDYNPITQPADGSIAVVYHDTYHALREENPTRAGYTFDGWFTQSVGGREVTPDERVVIESDTTLYAHWTANEYTISFNENGGSACEEKTVTYGKPYGTLPSPAKTGYQFVDWILPNEAGSDVEIKANSIVDIIKDTTLAAVWNPCVSVVTLDFNGGVLNQGGTEINTTTITVTYDDTYGNGGLVSGIEPARTGYDFAGWYLGTGDSAVEIEGTSKVAIVEPATIYAHWTAKKYTITLDPNGGQLNADVENPVEMTYDKNYGDYLAGKTPTRQGYIFDGWYLGTGAGAVKIEDSSPVKIENDTTIYAHWTAKVSTVTLDPNGGQLTASDGTAIDSTFSVTYDGTYSGLAGKTPTRTGYGFTGWYLGTGDSAVKIESTSQVNIEDDATFYAHWTANELTVSNPQDLDLGTAEYGKEGYSKIISAPEGGTGDYEYKLAAGSSLPKGLELVGNEIKGTLWEDVSAGPFTFKITITDKNSKKAVEPEFTISAKKAERDAPEKPQLVSRTSSSVTLKTISGAEYCVVEKGNSISTANWVLTTTFDGLDWKKEYDFYARFKEQANYSASRESEPETIRPLAVYTVQAQAPAGSHYTIVPIPENSSGAVDAGGSYTFRIEFPDEGYHRTSTFAVYADAAKQEKITPDSDGSYTIRNINEDKQIVVEGVGDVANPTGIIKIAGENSSDTFGRDISFRKFYNNAPVVTIEASDKEGGIQSISYYTTNEKEILNESQIRSSDIVWKAAGAGGSINSADINNAGKWVIYAKITDDSNNSIYLRSDGIVIDKTPPVITVITNDEVTQTGTGVYEALKEAFLTIQDDYLTNVTMDGNPLYSFEGKYSVPADENNHTIVAEDAAGNKTTYNVKVTMKKHNVTFCSGVGPDTVTPAAHNKPVAKPADPQKAGSIFYGWFLEEEEKEFDFATPITEDITLEAKWTEAGSSSVSKPVLVEKSQTRVILQQEEGCMYRMNWGEETESPVFTGLTPGKKYYFYKIDEKGTSEPLEVVTEGVSGATGMMALPSTLYQGEAYQIAPTVAMQGLLNKSADPQNSYVAWVVNKPDIVSVTNESASGCTLSINQVPYKKNRLTRVTLTATVVYSQIKQGSLVSKKKSYKKSFNVQNLCNEVSVDLSDFDTQVTETGAFVSGGAIYLMDKESVPLKAVINRGSEEDIATNQKLKWFISDKDGKSSSKGRKIATVNSKGVLKGVRPGTTYVTVAAADSYKKISKSYTVLRTYQVVCPNVKTISFDNSVEKTVNAGTTVELASALQYNPENVFNKEKMTRKWKSSDAAVAKVTSKGVVTFKKAGTVTITCTPTGGQEIDAATGKVSDAAKDLAAEITFIVQ